MLQIEFIVLVCHFISDQNPEETRNKKNLSPTMTKRTTSGQSNLTGTRTEGRLIVAKKSPAKDEECDRCFLNHYTLNLWEKGDRMRCQKCNVWNHETCFGAKDKRRLIYGRCYWSELRHQVIGIGSTEVRCRSIIRSCLNIFIITILNKFT